MAPNTQILLSGALTFGVPIAFAIHELIELRRPRRGGGGRRVVPPPQSPKPLPDCLIPKPRLRQPELEDA